MVNLATTQLPQLLPQSQTENTFEAECLSLLKIELLVLNSNATENPKNNNHHH